MLPSPCHCQTVHGANTDSSDRPQFILSLTSGAKRILRSAEKTMCLTARLRSPPSPVGETSGASSTPLPEYQRMIERASHAPCR